MTTSRKRSPAAAALVAALVLFVQTFLGGMSIGAQAAAGPRDVFGNVICTDHSGAASKTGQHGHGGCDCDCGLCCCTVAAGIVPQTAGVEQAARGFELVVDGRRLLGTHVPRHELQPLSSRGPPT